MTQKQLPASSGAFDSDAGTYGDPTHWIKTVQTIRHLEPWLVCMIPLYWWNKERYPNWIPLWRMNGAGENDSKIPVILCHGTMVNRNTLNYLTSGETHSIARFLANRGRDVWIMELEQTEEHSSRSYQESMEWAGVPWRTWYWEYLMTTDQATYEAYDAIFQAMDYCSEMTPIVNKDKDWTATYDTFIFEDIPAVIAKVLNTTGQTKVQWVGHSLGGTLMYGFMPTQYTTTGKSPAGAKEDSSTVNLPANSILSLTAIGSPSRLISVPAWLQDLYDAGDLRQAFMARGKLPRYFNYAMQTTPKIPIEMKGTIDTAQLFQLHQLIQHTDISLFDPMEAAPKFYSQLYEGETLMYPSNVPDLFYIYGHSVEIPTTILYDGNDYDDLGKWTNIETIYDALDGYKCKKAFYQFYPGPICHYEMITGYVFEEGDPSWPTTLQYDFGGTYHYIWYDLNRYLPPAEFSAYINDITTTGDPLISWQNNRDAVEYEIWAKQGIGSFTKKVAGVNAALSATECTGLSSGVWKIKVRAISLGGSWQDHSGENSIGGVDDETKYLNITKT